MLCLWLVAPLAAGELGGPALPRPVEPAAPLLTKLAAQGGPATQKRVELPDEWPISAPAAAGPAPLHEQTEHGLSVAVGSAALAVLALSLRVREPAARVVSRLRGGGLARALDLEMQVEVAQEAWREWRRPEAPEQLSKTAEAAAKIQRAWRAVLGRTPPPPSHEETSARYHEARSNPMFMPLLIAIERRVVEHLVGEKGVPKYAAQFMLLLLQRLPGHRDFPYKSLLLELIFSKAIVQYRRADTEERTNLKRLIAHLGGNPHGVVGRAAEFGLTRGLPAYVLSKALRPPRNLTIALTPHEAGPIHLV